MMFLLGRQAIFGHAPPTYFRSIEAVRLPSLAILQAINLPAVPLPSTRTSYLSGWLMPFISFVHQHVWDKRLFVHNRTRTIGTERVADGDTSLILFAESLNVGFAVRIEEFLSALLPSRFELGRCDIPVRPAFLDNGTQVLAEIFQSGPAEKPIAHVDLINHKTRFDDNRVGNHGIVERIGVFGDIEIFLDDTSCVGEERPMGTDSGAKFICLSDIAGSNRDKPAIANLELTMELN